MFRNKNKLLSVLKLVLIFSVFTFNFALASNDLKLSWKAPSEYTNGSRLNAKKDLKEYRLYYGSSIEKIKDKMIIVKPTYDSIPLSSLDLSKLKSSLVYFAMTSVLLDGTESELSPSIFYLP